MRRAAVAQQLHAVGPRSPASASLGVGVLLPGVVGGRTISVGGSRRCGDCQQLRSVGEPSSARRSSPVTRRSSGDLRREGPDPQYSSWMLGARDGSTKKGR